MTRRQKTALAALVAAAIALTAFLLRPTPKKPTAAPPPSPSASPSPSPTPSRTLPYAYFAPGTCFLVPRLSNVRNATAVPCDQAHDSEAISNAVLPDGLADLTAIGRAMGELCKAPAAEAVQRNGNGPHYGSPLGPPIEYYQQGMRDITCALTFRK